MAAICESVIKSWGNSAGVVVPKKIMEKEDLKVGQKVEILIRPETPKMGDLFGILKGKGLSGQECKDMCRKELWGIE